MTEKINEKKQASEALKKDIQREHSFMYERMKYFYTGDDIKVRAAGYKDINSAITDQFKITNQKIELLMKEYLRKFPD